MKFLLIFFGCFSPSKRPNHRTAPRTDETQLLESGNSPREQLNRSRSVPVTHWKPSLSAISEDKVVFVLAAQQTVGSGVKMAGKSGSKARIHFSGNSHYEHRRATSMTSTTFQAFAPAFIFG